MRTQNTRASCSSYKTQMLKGPARNQQENLCTQRMRTSDDHRRQKLPQSPPRLPATTMLKVHVALAVWKMSCTCVPRILAASPRKLSSEGWEQVEESPCLDDNVWHCSVCNHNLSRVTNPWGERRHLVTVISTYCSTTYRIITLHYGMKLNMGSRTWIDRTSIKHLLKCMRTTIDYCTVSNSLSE